MAPLRNAESLPRALGRLPPIPHQCWIASDNSVRWPEPVPRDQQFNPQCGEEAGLAKAAQFPADVQAILEMVRVTSNLRRLGIYER